MKFNKLKEVGTMVHEDDFYDNGIYLYSISYWVYNGSLYRHEKHSNQLQYTGRTKTEICSDDEANYYMEQFPEEDAKKCVELIGKYIRSGKLLSIKDNRIAAGLTQEEFSELFEIPIDTVKNWDSGRREPPVWAKKLIIKELERMKEQ
jgi:DNA-binding transcriptional regulator YiaG